MLREARLAAGLTQAELAHRVGSTQPMVAAYESGSREPSLASLDRLAGALSRRVALVAPIPPSYPDPRRSERVFLDLLDWLDRVPRARLGRSELGYPVMGRP